MVVQLPPLLDVLARDPGGHGHQGVQARQLGEVKPAVGPRPFTGPGVSVLLNQESYFSGHGFLETAGYKFVNEITNALFLAQIRNVVIGNILKGSTQPFEAQIAFLDFVFHNFLQVKKEDTMNVGRT